jgi:hypothetical protein
MSATWEGPPDYAFGERKLWSLPIDREKSPALLLHALLYCPGWYPVGLWQHMQLSVISLADLPGLEPAHRGTPEATHEIQVLVAKLLEDAPTPAERIRVAGPAELYLQLGPVSDEEARSLGHWIAMHSLVGWLAPISDLRSTWHDLVGKLLAELTRTDAPLVERMRTMGLDPADFVVPRPERPPIALWMPTA